MSRSIDLRPMRRVAAALALAALPCMVPWPAFAIDAKRLAVVYDSDDPESFGLAAYYAARRHIPPAQVIGVALGERRAVMPVKRFENVYREVLARTPPRVEAFALAWTLPYRVDCMSVTSAFAFGFDRGYCATGCHPTRISAYYDSPSRRPHRDHGLRPAMLLAARTAANARLMIERGIQSDRLNPPSRAYLVITPDVARSTRSERFTQAARWFGDRYPVEVKHTYGLRDVYDIMFYFTGTLRVPYLDTLGFLPGALADHLTSNGGVLLNSRQMSALDWIEAGATGTYGTVVEPCSFPQKFPDPAVAMSHYLDGETLIEAYWKSVAWPGQGVFVGEPLARPFAPAETPTDRSE